MRQYVNAVAVFALALLFFATGESHESLKQMEVRIPIISQADINELVRLRLTLTDRYPKGSFPCFLEAIVTKEELIQLRARGYSPEVLVPDISRQFEGVLTPEDLQTYHTYDEMVAFLVNVAQTYPGIALMDTIGYSVLNRPIVAMKITDNPTMDEAEPEILFEAATHGDEWMGVEVIISMIDTLTTNYGVVPDLTELVNERETWFVPMVNPDGVVATQRRNANGIDLNRDYGYQWEGWGSSPAPFSQPETRAIRGLFVDNQFVIGTSYHGGTQYVSYPWSYHPDATMDDAAIDHLAAGYSSTSGYPYGQGFHGMYEIHGSSKDSYYGLRGIFGWTVEVSNQKIPPASQIPYYVGLNDEAVLYLMDQVGVGISGLVTDSATGEPLPAIVWVREIGWPVYADPLIGDYHRFLLPNTYTLDVWANGYCSQTAYGVNVHADSCTHLDFQLTRGRGSYAYAVVSCYVADPYDAHANHSLTPWALGGADSISLSIGVDGWIVLDMGEGTEIVNRLGEDFIVYEGDPSPEGYSVSVSSGWDGPWQFAGSDTGTAGFDLEPTGLDTVRYVRIEDDGDGNPNASTAGFDLDAIEANPITGLEETQEARYHVQETRLHQNYPNPFSRSTLIRYTTPSAVGGRPSAVSLGVYDLSGKLVRTLVDDEQPPGLHSVTWDGSDSFGKRAANGIYFYRLTSGHFEYIKKLVVLK